MNFGNRKVTNRRWQERPTLYQSQFQLWKKIGAVLAILFLVVLLCVGVWQINKSEMFAIKAVYVHGSLSQVTQDDIIKLSHVKLHDNIFTTSKSEIRKLVARHPWVKTVLVTKDYPDAIHIEITERQPLAILNAGRLFFVDESGEIFKPVQAKEMKSLPVINGWDESFLRDFPHMAAREVKDVLQRIQYLNHQEVFKKDPLAEINWDNVSGMTVMTKEQGLEIYYGQGDIKKTQERLDLFLRSQADKIDRLSRIDVSRGDRIIVR